MKNPVESSVISRSQSESNADRGKTQLSHGTTTKLDGLFHILDQVCNKSHVPTFILVTAAFYVYYQIIVSSMYPFNKYWYEVNKGRDNYPAVGTVVTVFHYFEAVAWYFRIQDYRLDSSLGEGKNETDLKVPSFLVLAAFVFSVISVSMEMLGAFHLNKIRKMSYYTLRIGFGVASHAMNIPIGAYFGAAVRNLVLSGNGFNWLYIIVAFLMYFVSMSYIYVGFVLLNQSTTISIGPFSSFNLRMPFLLLVWCSATVICQCIFSLFDTWAMIIVQLAHLAVGIILFWQAIYLVFHSKLANIAFIGVVLSTWLNDVIFVILHFVEPPSGNSNHSRIPFYYLAGIVLPLLSLVISFVAAYIFVTFRYNSVVKELKELSEEIENASDNAHESLVNNDNQEANLLIGHKLFKNENSALMAIHLSFTNCLPLFYKWTAINYTVSQFPTTEVLMQIVHYLSFFPGASRKLNGFLTHISQFRSLNYHQRFLLFQIYRIKMLRQSSISPDSNRRLAELKSASNQAYDDVYCFWNSKTANVFYLEMISDDGWKIDNKWEEAIRDYPNFQKFSDEYCTFLIECQMDLERAILMKHRSNLIEMGKNFIIDVPFINLARHYPIYLKKGIIDYQGSFKNKQKDAGSNSANGTISTQSNVTGSSGSAESSGSSNSSLFSNYNLDPEIEETLEHQLFKQPILRLEMHRSLSHKKSYASKLLLFIALLVLFGGLALYLYIYYYIDNYVVRRSNSLYYLNLASKSRFYLDLSVLGCTLKFAYFTKRFTTLDYFNKLDLKDDFLKSQNKSNTDSGYDSDMFVVNDQISDNLIHRNNYISLKSFEQLLSDLSELGQNDDESIYTFAHIYMYKEVPFYPCYEGLPTNASYLTMKELESYTHLVIEQIASKEVIEEYWYTSDIVCELMSNQPRLEVSMLQLFTTLMQHEVSLCEAEDKFINIFSFVFPIIPLTIFLIPTFIFIQLFFKDANKLVNTLLEVSQEAKEEARQPIRKDSSVELVQPSERKPKSKHWIILRIVLLVLFIITAVIIYYMFSEIKELNGNVKKIGRWNLLASIRMASSVETMNYVLAAVILNGSSSFNLSKSDKVVSTRAFMLQLAQGVLVQLNNANEALLKGNELVGPSSGFDDKLDSINTETSCDVTNENDTDMHDSYRCSSASQGVGIFITLIEAIIDDIESTGGNFDNPLITHSLHLLNRHLLERLEQAVDRLHEVNLIMCSSFEKKTLILFICGMLIIVITFIFCIVFYVKSVVIYGAGMFLVQRLPPATFFSNKKLHNFVMSKKELKEESEMSTSQSVIFMSHDPIICTNAAGAIEIINPAVTETIGYTPDQMLGQHISAFFSNNKEVIVEEDKKDKKENENEGDTEKDEKEEKTKERQTESDSEKISNQLELMKNGQCAMVYEDHFICLTDDDREMPCGITILGMSSHGQTIASESDDHHSSMNVESFVIILRDETQLVQQQKEAEAAKAQSENLLFQILPRDIVVRLNSGEKDISFTVQSASIIFTDIVKFSEYASGLSPQEIMGSLSKVFAAFDACAKKYDLLTKIKLIGDIYMAAAGLFSDETVEPKTHALQILRFGIDCLNEIEEVNIKLNANLQLRVGINSGGPLLAGVLGTDKPVFDIIGDPINVAARLQTTDIPGKAQIPKSTYDLVCEEDFQIEERGEVFLKGKGKTMAYLVSSYNINSDNNNIMIDPSSSIPILEEQNNE